MEPASNEPIAKTVEKSPLHQVTPLSKYLAMLLFIIMPFLGGWIGYTYAPEKIIEIDKVVRVYKDTPSNSFQSWQVEPLEDAEVINNEDTVYLRDAQKNFTCNHKQLKYVDSSEYKDWPRFVDKKYGFSFAYPPNLKPNYIKYDIQPGVLFSIAYNQNLADDFGGVQYSNIDDTWSVYVTDGNSTLGKVEDFENNDVSVWYLAEEINLPETNVSAVVMSHQFNGMLYPTERRYFINLPNGLEIMLLATTIVENESECSFISDSFNLDFIAHSIRIES